MHAWHWIRDGGFLGIGTFREVSKQSKKNNLLSETAAEDEESENCIGGFEDNGDNFPDEKNIYCFAFI